jgi:hypothetical protein
MAGAGCPQWLGSAGVEWRWWSGVAVESADKVVRVAPDIGAELGAVTRSLEWDRGGVSRWLNDGRMMTQWRRRGGGGKGQLMGRRAPFKDCTRRWPRAAETVGETAGGSGGEAMGGQCGGHSLNAVVMVASLFGPCG